MTAGIEFLTLAKALSTYLPHPVFSPDEISLKIENELLKSDVKQLYTPEMAPLLEFLEASNGKSSQIADTLGQLFANYAVYGEEKRYDWEERRGWQQGLWNALFDKETLWRSPKVILEKTQPLDYPIALFGFSFVPNIYQAFFRKLGASHYLLSPSRHFWEDLPSDKRRVREIKKDAQVENYLDEKMPLLSNLGRLGQESIKRADEGEVITEEFFFQNENKALLGCLQDAILDIKPSIEPTLDDSLSIHSVTSKRREVEVLFQNLQKLLFEDDALLLSDIQVFAPSISEYLPYIQAIFGADDSSLDYRVFGLDRERQSPFLRAFRELLSLQGNRFSLDGVMKFLAASKLELRGDELGKVRGWFEAANIKWGASAKQREYYLGKASESGTWDFGFKRLLWGLAMLNSDENPFPLSCIETSEAELLGNVIEMLHSLEKDLLPIIRDERQSFREWVQWLKRLEESYFSNIDSALVEQFEKYLSVLEERESPVWPFSSIQNHLNKFFKSPTGSFQAGHLNSVTFSNLRSGAVTPAKVIVLLGLDEEAFPRSDSRSSLQQIQFSYLPSKTDQDRYLFLEVLLSARQHLLISYCRVSEKDGGTQGPSSVIVELQSFVSSLTEAVHPPLSFDAQYFEKESALVNLSQKDFQLALTEKEKALRPFFSPLSTQESGKSFTVHQLKKVARHPIQFFLNEALGIYIGREEEESGEFVLSLLDQAMMRQKTVTRSFDDIWESAEIQGELPVGVFKDAAHRRVESDVALLHANLEALGVEQKSLFSVELSHHCKEAQEVEPGKWRYPALHIGEHIVIGKIENLCCAGLLFSGKDALSDHLKAWPLYLLLQNLAHLPCNKDILFTKVGKRRTWAVDDPLESLGAYLDYAEKARQSLSPLMPQWASSLFSGKEPVIQSSTALFVDPYLKWFEQRLAGQKVSELWDESMMDPFAPLLSKEAANVL